VKAIGAAFGALLLAGILAPSMAAEKPAPLGRSAARGLGFARQHCSACHAVVPNRISPNPESPPFEDIANAPGLTAESFESFLGDSHNFPAAMNFTVDRNHIRDLAAYMLSLRTPGHRPQE